MRVHLYHQYFAFDLYIRNSIPIDQLFSLKLFHFEGEQMFNHAKNFNSPTVTCCITWPTAKLPKILVLVVIESVYKHIESDVKVTYWDLCRVCTFGIVGKKLIVNNALSACQKFKIRLNLRTKQRYSLVSHLNSISVFCAVLCGSHTIHFPSP